MTRNLIDEETAEQNRTHGEGGYTFNALIPEDYEGLAFVAEAIRLGEHAHVTISTGRKVAGHRWQARNPDFMSKAGRLVLKWPDWLAMRDTLEADERWRIAEIERPKQGHIERYAG